MRYSASPGSDREAARRTPAGRNRGRSKPVAPESGAPKSVVLDRPGSLSRHPESGVRFFSSTTTYTKFADIPASKLGAKQEIYLDPGEVKNLVRARLRCGRRRRSCLACSARRLGNRAGR
ncbi:MAG TPA: hypothetical protein VGC27_09830 [Rhizomicrobium sp.]